MDGKPWLEHYDQGVPHTLRPYPQETLLDVVSKTARQRPDHTALWFKGAHLSYAEVDRLSDAFAAGLVAQGLKKGDRVALLLPNCPQSVISQLGVWKAGAIAAPLNPLYTEFELEHTITECGAVTAVVLSPFYKKIRALCGRTRINRTKLENIIVTNIKEYLPILQRHMFTLFKEKQDGHRITLQTGDLWFADLLRQYGNSPRPNVSVSPDDPALLLFTGGTTGTPKGAVGTHLGLLADGMQLRTWFEVAIDKWDDVVLLLMPIFHVYGNVGVLITGLVGRNTLALVPNPRDLDDVIKTIRQVQPALVPGVPTLFNALLKHPDVLSGKVDFRSMKLCVSGAAALLKETKERFELLTGGHMIEAYGLTESFLATIITPVHGIYKPGAVGISLPDVEIRIADTYTGQGSLPSSEVGEILISAPQVMKEYWGRSDETADIIQDGWLHTGDLGYLDEDGYLFIVDRKKDLIKPSGFQVWPREVEEVIASHPAVDYVGVAGVPDVYQGEAVKAWIVLRPEEQLTSDEIRSFCREKLVGYKVPKHVEFRDNLPMSALGKVLRRELVEQ